MKKFIKLVDWRKFFKFWGVGTLILGVLYIISVANGSNVFPENLYIVPFVSGLWAFMLILSASSEYVMYLMRIKHNEKIKNAHINTHFSRRYASCQHRIWHG